VNNFKQTPPGSMFDDDEMTSEDGITVDDFVAYMQSHRYNLHSDRRHVASGQRQCTLHVADS